MGSKVALGNPNLQINLIITQSGNNSVATVNVKGNTQLYFVRVLRRAGAGTFHHSGVRLPRQLWSRACSPPLGN